MKQYCLNALKLLLFKTIPTVKQVLIDTLEQCEIENILFRPFILTALELNTILLLSPAKLTIYNTLHMSSYTTTSWSINKFSTREALYQMVTSAPFTQHTSSHHCENEYDHLCVGVFPCERVAIQYREKPLTVNCDLILNATSVGRACLISQNTS